MSPYKAKVTEMIQREYWIPEADSKVEATSRLRDLLGAEGSNSLDLDDVVSFSRTIDVSRVDDPE